MILQLLYGFWSDVNAVSPRQHMVSSQLLNEICEYYNQTHIFSQKQNQKKIAPRFNRENQ
jgi:hypothetical protein